MWSSSAGCLKSLKTEINLMRQQKIIQCAFDLRQED